MPFTLIATTFAHLEPVLADELQRLGANNIKVLNRAVSFDADEYLLYASNMYLRTAVRILQPWFSFTASSEQELYDNAMQQHWEEHLGTDTTFAIDFAVNSPYFHHSKYASLKLKDAIADYFRNKTGIRPSVDPEYPDVQLHMHIFNSTVNISIDTSGDALYKRGYRNSLHKAPLNEVLAAGMIQLSGWDMDSTFFDPMCGSGTLVIEAGMLANNIFPCLVRNEYSFKKKKNFNAALYKQILLDAAANVKDKKIILAGSDIDRKSIEMARQNAKNAKLDGKTDFFVKPFHECDPPKQKGTVMMNPPYGERLANFDIPTFYKEIGDTFKKKYSGYTAWILTSNKEAMKSIGLKTSKKFTLFNGPLECKLLRFDLYEGSRKVSK
ncbi:MAG: class I SAM-dependent RNA methyltransferase [Chitinophagales bacterium]